MRGGGQHMPIGAGNLRSHEFGGMFRLAAILFAGIIFAIDTFSPLETAVAVFYVVVILLAGQGLRRVDVVIASLGSVFLTVLSYSIAHGGEEPGAPLMRCIVSLCAIGITSLLVMRNRATEVVLRDQANLLELTHDAIFVRDMSDRIVFWNRGAEHLYGWSKEEAAGTHAHELLKTQFPEPAQKIRGELLANRHWDGELVHVAKSGARVVVSSRWALQVDERDRPVGVLDTNTDITAWMRDQQALNATRNDLAHAFRVATLGELTASIAHEVNQPLAAIITNAEASLRWINRDNPDLDETRNAVGRVITDGRRASDVIQRIRALAKKDKPNTESLNLNDVIDESVNFLSGEMSEHGVSVDLAVDPNLPAIAGDRIQLQQVLINLLINALQAMEDTQREDRRLSLRSFVDAEGAVNVTVKDNGPGLDPDMSARLFNSFQTTKEQGMGMGLSICRSIIEAHHGRIWAHPATAGGAVFQISLPKAGAL